MTWRDEAINKLKAYQAKCIALENLPDDIQEQEEKLSSIRSVVPDSEAVAGSGLSREDRMLNILTYREELKEALHQTTRWVRKMDKALSVLNEEEYRLANVNFQGRSGLTPKVIRRAERKCCEWCSNLAGVYDYPVDREVYQRHERCRCTVEYEPGDGRRQNVHTKRWTDAADSDTLESRKTVGLNPRKERPVRGMANGPRRGSRTIVTDQEQQLIRSFADELKIPQNLLSFNTGPYTSYDDATNRINVRGDVFPSEFAENPDSILSAKCALAHEYYGHYLHHSQFSVGDWRDEFHASYRASLDAPSLSQNERILLMVDAFERARVAGASVELSSIARRVIYGAE